MNDVDRILRAQMIELGKKGGVATKRRLDVDPGYYRALGARGGRASADARKARIAASLEQPKQSEELIVGPPAACEATTPLIRESTTSVRDKILAELEAFLK